MPMFGWDLSFVSLVSFLFSWATPLTRLAGLPDLKSTFPFLMFCAGPKKVQRREVWRWGSNLTHCSGQWAAYSLYPNMGACFARAVERRSALLNQCFTFTSCAHARLLCVKPQEAELAHHQQRAPLLHTPLAKKKKKLVPAHGQKLLTSCFSAYLKAKMWATICSQLVCWDVKAFLRGPLHERFQWQRGITLQSASSCMHLSFSLDIFLLKGSAQI